jgi:phosphopantothenoylcysteine synthetase/decarboxylase
VKSPSLKNKKILITAGPTWVSIDGVRVISNISTGQLGQLMANEAGRLGLKVDLFLGPVEILKLHPAIRLFRFRYFHELEARIEQNLQKRHYDIIFQSAAVSDYLVAGFKGKLSSQVKNRVLKLKKAPKLISRMRCLNPEAFLVIFKLESGVTESVRLRRAACAMKRAMADLAVANTVDDGKYQGVILDSKGIVSKSSSRQDLARRIFRVLKDRV